MDCAQRTKRFSEFCPPRPIIAWTDFTVTTALFAIINNSEKKKVFSYLFLKNQGASLNIGAVYTKSQAERKEE